VVEVGSPVPEIVAGWARGLAGRELIDWGGVALRMRALAGNLRRKAETLGLDPEAVTWAAPKRSFAVSDGLKPGAAVEVELRGAPRTLQAVWSWGLGQANSAGFGWVAA
jgi:CRISPR-associated endoribonuclease Cas6